MLWPWDQLKKLRSVFLGEAGTTSVDYWRTPELVAAYDATFAERIGWKIDFVLDDLRARGFSPQTKYWIDWACGTGVAARKLVDFAAVESLTLFDRSRLAVDHALATLPESVRSATQVTLNIDRAKLPSDYGVILSHVANELTSAGRESLNEILNGARTIIWIEPGTPAHSQMLVAARERLRGSFRIIAPCPHETVCGLADGKSRHWCHHFANPPSSVFGSSEWARFSKEMGIDLRSLPLSYLVLDRAAETKRPEAKIIGRPRVYTGYANVLTCTAAGVEDRKVMKRADPAYFKRLQKGEIPTV